MLVKHHLKLFLLLNVLDVPLVAGLTNCVSLCIATGPAAILNQSIIEMTSESGLMFQGVESGKAVITSESDEEYMKAEYNIELEDKTDEMDSKMSTK